MDDALKTEEVNTIQQVNDIRAAVAERLNAVWDGLDIIEKAEGGLACFGTMTALLHKAIFFQSMWAVYQERGFAGFAKHPIPADLKEQFVRMAGDCWDEANGRTVGERGGGG